MKNIVSKFQNFQDSNSVVKLATGIFYAVVVIETLIVLIDKSALINPFEGRLFQITFALCAIKVLLTRYDLKEYMVIFALCVFGLLVDVYGNRNEVLRFVMFVAACKNIDIKKSLKLLLWVQIIGCTVIALLSLTGIYGPLTVAKEYENRGFFTRYCFGMGNANSFHAMFFVSVLLTLYLYYEKCKWWVYVLLFAVNIGFFLLTDSKTSVLMTGTAVICFWVLKIIEKKQIMPKVARWISTVSLTIYAVLIGLSVIVAIGAKDYCRYFWDAKWEDPPNPPRLLIFLDRLLTGRVLSLTEYDMEGAYESWSVMTTPNHNVNFDLGYIRVFYWYGIIPAIVIFILILALYIALIKNKRYSELIFLTMIAIYTFPEAHFVSVYIGRSYVLFILGMVFWSFGRNSKWEIDSTSS